MRIDLEARQAKMKARLTTKTFARIKYKPISTRYLVKTAIEEWMQDISEVRVKARNARRP